MIQSSGDSYTPSRILPSARDVGQRWKSEAGLGEDFEVHLKERLIEKVPQRGTGSGLWEPGTDLCQFAPSGVGLLKSIKEIKDPTSAIILHLVV